MRFDILTIFPQSFFSYFDTSIIKRGIKKGILDIKIHDIRDWATDRHKEVDDKPYGGGVGMVLKAEPIYRALKQIKLKAKHKIILFTPGGKKFDQKKARQLVKLDQIIMICGHYEGVDARVEKLVDEKLSIGDYVLTGGEIPAMIVVDVVSRLIPGILGKTESFKRDTFSQEGYIKYSQYTRPAEIIIKTKTGKKRKLRVPKILLSGNHRQINEWRAQKDKKNKFFKSV